MNSCSSLNFNNKSTKMGLPQPSEKPYLAVFSQVITPIKKEVNETLSVEIDYSYIGRSEYKIPNIGKEDENPEREIIIGCTLKSKFDNTGNRIAPIDILVAFDISGSMKDSLNSKNNFSFGFMDNNLQNSLVVKTRAQLAKKALQLLKNQLSPEDRIGLLTFNDSAFKVFDIDFIKNIKDFDNRIKNIAISGGTSISSCINLSIEMFETADKELKSTAKDKSKLKRFRRLILLTDMNDTGTDDDLIQGIQNLSTLYNISTTVAGMGQNVDIALSEKVSKARGFNYFTSSSVSELKSHIDKFNSLFFPLVMNASINIESGDIEVKKVYGTNFENKLLELDNQFGLKEHWLSSPLVRLTTEVLLFYFKKVKSKRLPKPVLCNVLDFLSYNKKVRNICEISSCTAIPMINDNEAKGKFFVIIAKLKDSKLYLNNKIQVKASFNLSYVDLTNPDNLHEVGVSPEKKVLEYTISTFKKYFLIENKQKIQINKKMYNGLCLFYYNKFIRDICRKFHQLEFKYSKIKDDYNSSSYSGSLNDNLSDGYELSHSDEENDKYCDNKDTKKMIVDLESKKKNIDTKEIKESKLNIKNINVLNFLSKENLDICTNILRGFFEKGFYTDNIDLVQNLFISLEKLREKIYIKGILDKDELDSDFDFHKLQRKYS